MKPFTVNLVADLQPEELRSLNRISGQWARGWVRDGVMNGLAERWPSILFVVTVDPLLMFASKPLRFQVTVSWGSDTFYRTMCVDGTTLDDLQRSVEGLVMVVGSDVEATIRGVM